MKTLKKITALVLALIATVSLAACSNKSPAHNTQPENPLFTEPLPTEWEDFSELPEEEPSEQQPEKQKYETQELTPYGATAQAKDTFLRFADDEQKMLYTTDGRLLHSQTLEDSFWFGNRDVQSVCTVWNDPAYMDANGYLYVYEKGKEFPCKDIRGEIFWAFVGMLDGELILCSRDTDGTLYINSIDKTGIKSRDNERLYLYVSDTETYIDRVDTVRFVQDDMVQANIYAEADGVAYYSNVTGISFFDGKPQIWVAQRNCWQAADVLDYGYGGAQSPLYKKAEDQMAVYYRYGFNHTELPVYMPAGKTVEELERVVFGDITYLFFNDGSVYSGQLVHTVVGPKLVLDATLTALQKAGAIEEVYQSTFYQNGGCQLRLLLDDNVTYNYTPICQ